MHAVHGTVPVLTLKVEPSVHGTLHTVSAWMLQAVATPFAHVAQAAQGAAPVATLKVAPAVHGALHTVSAWMLQAVATPLQ